MHQRHDAWFTFPIDHIIARQHRGQTVEGNLALSCYRCNSFKGPNIASIDPETERLVPLFHPRRDSWTSHFEWDGPWLRGLTPVGRATVELLQINHPDAVLIREELIREGAFSA
jgi:hypothetical protein